VSEPHGIGQVEAVDDPAEKFREFLAIRGIKLTKQRRMIVEHVFATHKHFDADELVAELRNAGPSRATVYRTLQLMVEAGLLRELRLSNRTTFEHDYGYPSHDHLHCIRCHKVIEFSNEEIQTLSDQVCEEHGFIANGHRFVIEGICAECGRARNRRRALDLI
jgi:Fur family ferric uptake transcriptional regulator